MVNILFNMTQMTLYITAAIVALVILSIIGLMSRYRKCPSNKMLVVFGSTGKSKDGALSPAKVLHGGGTFVWPVIQDYAYIDVTPIQISTKAQNILSAQNINVSFPVNLTVAIDTSNPQMMQNAASRLLGMDSKGLLTLLTNNLLGGLRQVVANMTIEKLKSDRDGLYEQATKAIKPSLDELGFKIIDLNMEDLEDDGNYLENLSKKAKAEAAAIAKADIAEKEKDGAIKEAAARKEKEITVGNTLKEQELTLATIDKEKSEQKAEIAKNKAVAVANQAAEQRANVAKAEAEASKAEANAVADAEAATASADAIAKAKVAEAKADSLAKQAEYNAKAATRKEEANAAAAAAIAVAKATADQQQKEKEAQVAASIAAANADKDAKTQEAEQNKQARIAEATGAQQERAAKADQAAKVARQQANAEIAKAEGEAEKARQEANKVAGLAEVEAILGVEEQKQVRQLQVNEAEARATAARLNAEQIVPAEAAKKAAEIEAQKKAAIKTIEAEAEGKAQSVKAKGEADAITTKALAESDAIKLKGEAEAAATRAKLEAEAQVAVQKAEGLAKAEYAGMNEFIDKLGDPVAAVSYFKREQEMQVGIAEANSKVLHEVFGQVTVYGDAQTAGNMASSLLGVVPQIKQMGKALSEGITTVRDAWKGNLPTSESVHKTEQPQDVDSLGEHEFEDVK